VQSSSVMELSGTAVRLRGEHEARNVKRSRIV